MRWLVPACDQGGRPSSVALCPWGQIRGTAGEDLGTGVAGAVTAGDRVQGHGAGAVGPGGSPLCSWSPSFAGSRGAVGPCAALGPLWDSTAAMNQGLGSVPAGCQPW